MRPAAASPAHYCIWLGPTSGHAYLDLSFGQVAEYAPFFSAKLALPTMDMAAAGAQRVYQFVIYEGIHEQNRQRGRFILRSLLRTTLLCGHPLSRVSDRSYQPLQIRHPSQKTTTKSTHGTEK